MEKKKIYSYTADSDGIWVVDALTKVSDFSKSAIKRLMSSGAVWFHSGKKQRTVRKASATLKKDEKVKLYFDPNIKEFDMSNVRCVHDTHNWGIWYKPAGLLSQGTKYGDEFTILRHIEKSLKKEIFLIHRLDRETAGLMIFAYNKKAARLLSEQIKERRVEKFYQAVVHGELKESGEIKSKIEGKDAHSIYKVKSYNDKNTQVEVQIITGRKHQIRVHMAELGHPVIGDRIHGKRDGRSLKLVAHKLHMLDPYRPQNKLEFHLGEKEKLF
ncbi:MAG: hypothetical protein CME69_10720 [Halobacteriovorax sp.]|nr:hypothetical protein [Halobacteriovorax sp.]